MDVEHTLAYHAIILSFSRWIRLLFSREFPFKDVLVIWDALFADGSHLDLVDYIYIAMLQSIRNKCKYCKLYVFYPKKKNFSQDNHSFGADLGVVPSNP